MLFHDLVHFISNFKIKILLLLLKFFKFKYIFTYPYPLEFTIHLIETTQVPFNTHYKYLTLLTAYILFYVYTSGFTIKCVILLLKVLCNYALG